MVQSFFASSSGLGLNIQFPLKVLYKVRSFLVNFHIRKYSFKKSVFSYRTFKIIVAYDVLVNPVIHGLFICEFAYSHLKNWSKRTNFWSKCVFLSANSVFAVQNSGTHLPRKTVLRFFLISFTSHHILQ